MTSTTDRTGIRANKANRSTNTKRWIKACTPTSTLWTRFHPMLVLPQTWTTGLSITSYDEFTLKSCIEKMECGICSSSSLHRHHHADNYCYYVLLLGLKSNQ
mmetsp:Transcript_17164/g.25909  ORF Transcript_17164/g.25909 Transcript_17164/m.25909 type:complete len:102 (+) Transcript_17164:65-370(+)